MLLALQDDFLIGVYKIYQLFLGERSRLPWLEELVVEKRDFFLEG